MFLLFLCIAEIKSDEDKISLSYTYSANFLRRKRKRLPNQHLLENLLALHIENISKALYSFRPQTHLHDGQI